MSNIYGFRSGIHADDETSKYRDSLCSRSFVSSSVAQPRSGPTCMQSVNICALFALGACFGVFGCFCLHRNVAQQIHDRTRRVGIKLKTRNENVRVCVCQSDEDGVARRQMRVRKSIMYRVSQRTMRTEIDGTEWQWLDISAEWHPQSKTIHLPCQHTHSHSYAAYLHWCAYE